MAKKIVLALLVAAMTAGGAFALDMSAGLGGNFSANFSTFAWNSDGKDEMPSEYRDAFDYNLIGGGFFAFFDAQYAMVSMGLNFWNERPVNKDEKKDWDEYKIKVTYTSLNIGVLGKYPIDLGGFTLFPMIGFDAQIILSGTESEDGEKEKIEKLGKDDDSVTVYYSNLWFKFGVGADIPLGEQMYLRPMFLYGFGTLNKGHKDSQDWINDEKKLGSYVNHGLDIVVALGFKF